MFFQTFRPLQFIVPVLIVVISSCSEKSDNIQTLLNNLHAGTVGSNETIQRSNTTIYESIKIKSSDPATTEQAIAALHKADSVRNKTERIRSFFLHLRRKINEDKFVMNDADLSAKVFEQIRNHNKYLIGVDSLFGIAATRKQLKLSHFETKGLRLFEQNLIGIEKPYQSLFFDKLSADAVIDENILLNNLHNQLAVTSRRCVFISSIVGVNTTVISLGDSVEILGGVGYFESMKNSKMIVEGKTVYPNEKSLFVYKYPPADKKGIKIIPVQVFYTDMDGNDVVAETKMKITVK